MNAGAREDADERQAAPYGQLGGTLPMLVRERVNAVAEPMERRTYVLLHHRPAGAR